MSAFGALQAPATTGSSRAGGMSPSHLPAMSRLFGKPYFVYILWSPTAQRFYIGISEDPDQHPRQHNEGKRGWTARHRPWILAWVERHQTYAAARKMLQFFTCVSVGRDWNAA